MKPSIEYYTYHAQIRGQQRGIKPRHVTLLYSYGSEVYHKGREIICFDRKGWNALIRDNKTLPMKRRVSNQELDRLKSMYVVDGNGQVVTIGHRHKKKSLRRNN